MASEPTTNGVNHASQPPDTTPPAAELLDPSLDADPEVSGATQEATTQSESMQRSTSTLRAEEPTQQTKDTTDARQEAMDFNYEETRLPLRKDVSMREFLSKMDDYAPVIPDAVTFHALTLAGLKPPPLSSLNAQQQQQSSTDPNQPIPPSSDPTHESDHIPLRLARLISLATQKFIADVATDAYQYSRMRTGVLTSNSLSAMANPGAAAGAAGAAAAAAGGGTGGGGAGAGNAGTGKSGANAHILGVPRAGFGGGGQGGAANRAVLTMEDLGMALGEYGVNVKRGEFYR